MSAEYSVQRGGKPIAATVEAKTSNSRLGVAIWREKQAQGSLGRNVGGQFR